MSSMSASDSTRRFPVSADSARAKTSLCSRMRSATRSRIFPRSVAGVAVHSPASKVARATVMARMVSASEASETVPTWLPSAGQMMVRTAASDAASHAPLMNSDLGAPSV